MPHHRLPGVRRETRRGTEKLAGRRRSDGSPDAEVAHRAAQAWGVLSTEELIACGLSYDSISDRAASGRLHRLHQGVYAVGHPGVPLDGRFLAAVKACGPRSALSHFAAAAFWGIVPWEERQPVDVTVPADGSRGHRGLRVHRSGWLEPRDVWTRQGIPVTSPARTVLDVVGWTDRLNGRRALRQAESVELVNLRQLAELLGRAGRRRGTGKLARLIVDGPAPTRSALEDIVLDLILDAGFQRPEINVPMLIAGRTLIPDFRWPEQRLIVEADGARWHDNKLAREDDAERQALLEAHGERVVRIRWPQTVGPKRRETTARLEAAGAPR